MSVIFVAKWRAVTSDRPSGILPDPSVCPMGKNSALVLRELYYTHVDSDEHLIKSVILLNLFQKNFEYMYHHKNISDISRQKSMLQC